MPKLTDQEMMDFLAERSHLARIATVRTDGCPSARKALAKLSAASVDKVLGDNAVRFFGI